MNGMGSPIEMLRMDEPLESISDQRRRNNQSALHGSDWPKRVSNTFDPAQSAPGGAGQAPPPLLERVVLRPCDPHAQLDSVTHRNRLKTFDLRERANDALGQAEADREVLQIRRRGHHYCVGRAV